MPRASGEHALKSWVRDTPQDLTSTADRQGYLCSVKPILTRRQVRRMITIKYVIARAIQRTHRRSLPAGYIWGTP